MIVIHRHNDGMTISGHAGYAQAGQDIVCAGVSTLVQTLIQSIEDLTEDKIEYDIMPGMANIKHGTLSAGAQLLMKSFFIGIELIASEYPYHVKLTKH